MEVSGNAEHEQIVLFATDTPPIDVDAVYTVQALSQSSNFQGTVHAREMLVLGGTVTGPGSAEIEDDTITPAKLLADEAAQQAAFRACLLYTSPSPRDS